MSTDTLALIGSGIGGLLTLGIAMFAGFAWVIRRIDEKVDAVDTKLDRKIDAVERNLTEFRTEVAHRFTEVEHELTEVKIAIARIEGPRPRLIVER